MQEAELLAGIVDQGTEVSLRAGVELAGEELGHALADGAGAVVEDMGEGLILAVYVAHEVFGGRWQVADSLEVDDFGIDRLPVGEGLCEELKVASVVGGGACGRGASAGAQSRGFV